MRALPARVERSQARARAIRHVSSLTAPSRSRTRAPRAAPVPSACSPRCAVPVWSAADSRICALPPFLWFRRTSHSMWKVSSSSGASNVSPESGAAIGPRDLLTFPRGAALRLGRQSYATSLQPGAQREVHLHGHRHTVCRLDLAHRVEQFRRNSERGERLRHQHTVNNAVGLIDELFLWCAQKRLRLILPDSLVGIRRGPVRPALQLLHSDRVRDRGLWHLNLQASRRPNAINPRRLAGALRARGRLLRTQSRRSPPRTAGCRAGR
jgi:hypothetical protein